MLLLTHWTSLVHFCYTVWCDAVTDPLIISRTLLSHCDVMLLLTHRTSLVHFCYTVWCDAVTDPQNISRTLLSHCVMWCRYWPTEHLSYTFVTLCDVMPLLTHWTSLVHFCYTVWCDAVTDPLNISRTLLSHCDVMLLLTHRTSLVHFFTLCDVMPLVTHRTSLVHFCHTVWCDAVADPQNISRTLLSHCVMWCRYWPAERLL